MPRGWLSLGTDGVARWGEYQGSAASPYRVASDVDAAGGLCSCLSRRVPCKHVQALRLEQPAVGEPPDWVQAWLARRPRVVSREPLDPARAAAEQARRMARREERISQGVEDLERWLQDLVRVGLAEAAARPWASFEQMSARLVDAQAPGLARFVRDLGSLPHSTTNWPERMLIDLGQLALLSSAWRRLDRLEPDLRAEIRALVGINEPRNDVLATPPVHDMWDVVGRRSLAGERMLVQRTWLWGRRTRRWALVLEFAMPGQLIDERLTPGLAFEGGLHFYAGAVRLRALFGEPPTPAGAVASLPTQSVQDLLRTFAEWLGRNPWLERMPAALSQVVPQHGREEAWWLRDADGQRVPLSGPNGWQLVALSGGKPIDVSGEWDGFAFWPLGARDGAELVPMRVAPAFAEGGMSA